MNEMLCFLNSHPEIRDVVLLVGRDYIYENLKQILKNINVDKMVLVSSFSKKKLKKFKCVWSTIRL